MTEITQGMRNFYKERTARHIDLVRKYCDKINAYETARFNHPFSDLVEWGNWHDRSKYKEPEATPYIYITWQYRCKDLGKPFVPPDDMKRMMSEATFHHVKNNSHHPEYWDDCVSEVINREDRDKPSGFMVDASKMPNESIAEMVADWMAMAEEKGTSAKDWADKNVNIRWKFTEKQKSLIYELVNNIDVAARNSENG